MGVATIYIGLGTNLGNRQANLMHAYELFRPEIHLKKTSSVYETDPMYRLGQPLFLNTVCRADTELSPHDVLDKFKAIEKAMGRKKTVRNGPRVIDLDLLFYDDLVLNTPTLTIPHPRIAERAFVLAPLARIAPNLVHPVLHETIAGLLSVLGDYSGKISKIDEGV